MPACEKSSQLIDRHRRSLLLLGIMRDDGTLGLGDLSGRGRSTQAWGELVVVNACYCDYCQAAAQRLVAAFANWRPAVASADGGTEFMLFRWDRIACTRGAHRLQAMRLTDASKTRRMIAGCCATPMYLSFDDKRPWVSAFRASFGADAPPVEMRICTRFRRSEQKSEDGLPSHPGYPPAMIVRIFAVWPLMLFGRPVGALP